MQQEETEFRSDGTKKVLRPARLSLARVSVLRGEGQSEGAPFIDDLIHTSEVIVDYLTEFSGIRCESAAYDCPALANVSLVGDLDPHITRYTLTPLKLVYKKLRLLVDLGCIFIGHGLSKDFRIISASHSVLLCYRLPDKRTLCPRYIRPSRTSHRYSLPVLPFKPLTPFVPPLSGLVRPRRKHPDGHARLD